MAKKSKGRPAGGGGSSSKEPKRAKRGEQKMEESPPSQSPAHSDSEQDSEAEVSGKFRSLRVRGGGSPDSRDENKIDENKIDGDGDAEMGEASGVSGSAGSQKVGILIVDEVKQGQDWSGAALRAHMREHFPGVNCKARFLRRVYDLEPPQAIDTLRELD